MNICHDCGFVFDEPARARERLEHFGTPCLLDTAVCPACFSDEIGEAARCARCGEYRPASKVDFGLCEDCGAAVARELGELLTEHFSDAETLYVKEALLFG